MKIVAPADSAREAGELIGAGAGVLYFGFIPEDWLEDHTFLESFNRRTFPEAQVTSWDEVSSLIETAGAAGIPSMATFNAAFYSEGMYSPVLETMGKLARVGVSGFIVSDIPLILMAKERGLGPLSLSTMGGVMSSPTVRFYHRLGLRSMTLPRVLSTSQAEEIARANPEVSFDVFILFGACANVEAFCRWGHDDPGRVWPCVKEYRGPAAGEHTAAGLAAAAQAGWSGLSRIWSCGLCAIHRLFLAENISGLKIVGRGAPTERKLAGIRAVRELLDVLVAGGAGPEAFHNLAREHRQALAGGGCHPYLCYFPEFL